jgi:nucleotide-binding universal stress UspA family protein
MGVYRSVVVGTDGSRTASEAVQRAGVLAAALGAQLVVASAYSRPVEEHLGPPSERAGSHRTELLLSGGYRRASEVVADGAGIARQVAPGVDVDTCVTEGDPAEVLLRLAEDRPGSLLTVGSQGMTGSGRFLGSVPNKVSHHAPCDLLIVRTGEGRPPAVPSTVVIGTDGSATATRAVRRGLEVAASVGARVTLLTAMANAERGRAVLEGALALAEEAGVEAATALRSGDAPTEILAAAAEHDLTVLGNKGMTGPGRFLLGSVPNKVSHHAPGDLLIVKTT